MSGISVLHRKTHTQSTPATLWTINHGLNLMAVVVDAFIDNNGTYEKTMPVRVQIVDANTVTLLFESPQIGYAKVG